MKHVLYVKMPLVEMMVFCDATLFGSCVQTFWRSVPVLSLGCTQHHIPEELNLNIHCHGNIKYHAVISRVKMADRDSKTKMGTWFLPTSKIILLASFD
jgi:hypothetical protein